MTKSSSWLKGRWPLLGRSIQSTDARRVEDDAVARASENSKGEAEGVERKRDEKPSWNFEPGAQLTEGRSVLKRLSGGNRYEVFLTWDERLFAITVTKVLRPDQVTDEHALSELRREVEVLRRLAHPCLVRCFDAVLEGPHPHVVIEHLEGPTLRRLIKQQTTIPLNQLLPLALHVAAVLQYMANERFVHLDVKPSNIVMGVPPRLIDLSIAQSFESAARLRHSLGTDPYMPPEQCDPAAHPGRVGHASDIWGLGATLYHAATGETPFPRGTHGSTERTERFPQLVLEPKPLPRHIPEPLRKLISSMLAKDPAERPAAADVATILEPLVALMSPRLKATRRGIHIH
ncbi:MAG TPA: serine/threonine-protein kinase [Pyrinomonadaceae bacterium]|nr:serine/threonine-protein kinase [Pyrinomonadaceae bacterium]